MGQSIQYRLLSLQYLMLAAKMWLEVFDDDQLVIRTIRVKEKLVEIEQQEKVREIGTS